MKVTLKRSWRLRFIPFSTITTLYFSLEFLFLKFDHTAEHGPPSFPLSDSPWRQAQRPSLLKCFIAHSGRQKIVRKEQPGDMVSFRMNTQNLQVSSVLELLTCKKVVPKHPVISWYVVVRYLLLSLNLAEFLFVRHSKKKKKLWMNAHPTHKWAIEVRQI